MSESVLSIQCWNPQQAHAAMTAQIWPMLKSMTMAGHPMVLELRKQTRSLKENAMLHAMLAYISKNMDWAGAKRDVDTWKRLMVAAWCRARNEQIEILPAIDGHGVDIVFRKTSKLNRAECAELIEFIFAWAAMHGMVIPEQKQITPPSRRLETVDADTGEILEVA